MFNTPTADEIISTLLSTDGNLDLSSLRLKLTKEEILNSITNDKVIQDTFISQLRTRLLIKHFRTAMLMTDIVFDTTDNMKPGEKLKFLEIVSNNLTSSIGKPNTTNTLEVLLNQMPEEPKQALLKLLNINQDRDSA
jgi:hypothetical protein